LPRSRRLSRCHLAGFRHEAITVRASRTQPSAFPVTLVR
jgi:hypothetical protein